MPANLKINDLIDQQFGEDMFNSSSDNTANDIKQAESYSDIPRHEDLLPIIVSANGTILDGHHRVAAAIKNGYTTIHALVEQPKKQSVDAAGNYNLSQLGVLSTLPQQPGHTIHAPHSTELSRAIPLIEKSAELPESDKVFARMIPTFQGGKTKMAYAITDKIKKFFGGDANKITIIDDWFGGSGGWGGYLSSAAFKNVKTIRVHEFSPDRLEKIKLFHEHGNEVGALFKSKEIAPYIKKLIASVEESGTFSGSGISNRVDAAFEIGEHQGKLGDMVDAITSAMKDQGDASFGLYGKGESARHAVNDLIRRVTDNAEGSYKMFHALRERGVKVEYIVGDSYAQPHIKGDHVLSVIDPPYYATKGYNGENIVGMETYNKTRLLIDRVVKDDNSLLYTDEAWFDKAEKKTGRTVTPVDMHKSVDKLDAKGQLLAIRSGVDAFFRTPIDGRIETVGLHNGQSKRTSGISDIGGVSEKGIDQAQRPEVGGVVESPIRYTDEGLASGREGNSGPATAKHQGLKTEPPEILYNDEAWWLKAEQMADKHAAGATLTKINNMLSNLHVAPQQIGNRYEQLGIHNPSHVSGQTDSSGLGGKIYAGTAGKGTDGRGSGDDSGRATGPMAEGTGEQSRVAAKSVESPEITAAREAIPSIESDRQFEIEHDDGTIDTGSASELMARADEEDAFAEQSDTATTAAISCFLKFGDL